MTPTPRRLVAWIGGDAVPRREWEWKVETRYSDGSGGLQVGAERSAIEAMEAAEKYADSLNFGIRWNGFVGHGVRGEDSPNDQ